MHKLCYTLFASQCTLVLLSVMCEHTTVKWSLYTKLYYISYFPQYKSFLLLFSQLSTFPPLHYLSLFCAEDMERTRWINLDSHGYRHVLEKGCDQL